MKKSDRLRRSPWSRVPLARFLIVCEGDVTERIYFKEVGRLERGLVDVEIISGGVPKTLVERAVQRKKESEQEARRRKDQNRRYDEVWCVFDIDVHPFVAEAKQQAKDNGIDVAVSNPCFELWLLLHFQERTAHIERDKAGHLCREHMPGYRKTPPCEALMPRQQEAITRAVQLDKWQAERDNAGGNPSTGVYQLVQRIKAAREPSARPTYPTR